MITTEQVDSRELMARAQDGDVDAFGEIYARYRPMVVKYAAVRIPHHAEDIAQDVFVRALGALSRWQDQGRDPGAWLITITANLCRDRAKSSAQRTTAVTDDGRVPEPPAQCDYSQAVVDGLTARKLLAPLGTLKPAERRALVLYYVLDLPQRLVADEMGLTESVVKALLYRARHAMAAQLAAADA